MVQILGTQKPISFNIISIQLLLILKLVAYDQQGTIILKELSLGL